MGTPPRPLNDDSDFELQPNIFSGFGNIGQLELYDRPKKEPKKNPIGFIWEEEKK